MRLVSLYRFKHKSIGYAGIHQKFDPTGVVLTLPSPLQALVNQFLWTQSRETVSIFKLNSVHFSCVAWVGIIGHGARLGISIQFRTSLSPRWTRI